MSSTSYGMGNFTGIPNYPYCPTYISTSDSFEYATLHNGTYQYGRFRAVFVSTQTGKHNFFAIMNDKGNIDIETNPKGYTRILQSSNRTEDNWSDR